MDLKLQISDLLKAIDVDQETSAEVKERYKAQIAKLVVKAAQYVAKVAEQGIEMHLAEGITDRDTMEALSIIDASRSKIHNDFIAQLHITSRIFEKYHQEDIYKGKEVRREQGDFAMDLVSKYFETRL